MANPKAPHKTRVLRGRERRGPRPAEFPLRRLREAGANTLQLKIARSTWEKMGEVEREAAVAELQATPTDELRAELDRDRETIGDETAMIDTTWVPRASIREVMAWVGDDHRRARAALDQETRRPYRERRKTLVERLERKARR